MIWIPRFSVSATRANREPCRKDQQMFIDMKTFKKHLKPGVVSVTFSYGNVNQKVEVINIHAGVASRWLFFCPECGERVNRLYLLKDGLKCRNCIKEMGVNLYAGIQHTTRGGDTELAYRMERYAAMKGIKFEYPFDYMDFLLDDRNRKKSFRNAVKVLQAMENMRNQAIFFGSRFDAAVIKQVTTGKHPLLQKCTLADLRNRFYDWYSGEPLSNARIRF